MTPNFESRIRMNPDGSGVSVSHDGPATPPGMGLAEEQDLDLGPNPSPGSYDHSEDKTRSKVARKPRTNVSESSTQMIEVNGES